MRVVGGFGSLSVPIWWLLIMQRCQKGLKSTWNERLEEDNTFPAFFFSSTPDDFYAIKVRQKHHTVDFPIPSLNVSSLQIMLKKAPFPLSLGYTSQINQPESDLINCSHYGREFLFYFFKAQVSKTRTGGLNCTRCNSYVAH